MFRAVWLLVIMIACVSNVLAGGWIEGRVVDTGTWTDAVYYWIHVEDPYYSCVDSVLAHVDDPYITSEIHRDTYTVICSLYNSADSCLAGLGKLNVVVANGDTTLCNFNFAGLDSPFEPTTWAEIKQI